MHTEIFGLELNLSAHYSALSICGAMPWRQRTIIFSFPARAQERRSYVILVLPR